MGLRTLCILAMLTTAAACGGDDSGEPMYVPRDDAGTGMLYECEDEDGDGFGTYCDSGRDCDDSDPEVTDLCYRCADDNPGCPCEPGTRPQWCNPEDQHVVIDGVTGTLVCDEGTQYCREGQWSECEILMDYATFVADE